MMVRGYFYGKKYDSKVFLSANNIERENIMQQPANLIEALVMRAEHNPENIAFSYLDDQCNVVCQLSNQQLHVRAVEIAGKLQQIISPADRVLLLFPQGLEFIYAFMGVMYSGAIPVTTAPPPKNTHHGDDRAFNIKDVIEKTNVDVVLTSTSILDEVVQYFFKSKTLSEKVFLSVEEITGDFADYWSMPLIENTSVAYLQRTSDKNRIPKFVMISHDNMKNTHESIKREYRLTTSSRSVNWLPHYHYLGLVLGILQPLYCGYRGYIYSPFDFYKNPHGWLHAITKYEATFSGAPDFAYSMCVEKEISSQQNLNLSKWNTAYNSGEPVKKETMDGFFKKFRGCGLQKKALASVYGLAESSCVTSSKNQVNDFTVIPRKSLQYLSESMIDKIQSGHENIKIISCGSAVPGVQVVIVVPGTRIRSDDLELGEILVSSACNALAYWGKPAEKKEMFNIYLEGSGDGPYLRTGDLGFMKKGELHVVGRLKNDGQVDHSPVNILQHQPVNEQSTH